jgi:dTDP-4-amino-4,6-dideoxygalactose transaminase
MIQFNSPYVNHLSKKYSLEVLTSEHQQGDGPFTKKSSERVSNIVGGGYVLLTPSCTHALEMASLLCEIGPGDEVILPSFTFTSAATAVTKFGAVPVFVDSEASNPNINVEEVKKAITPRTKAISWVNYGGTAPDIEALQAIREENKIILIEDNAHGLGGTFKGKPLGSFGDFATQSFHATKNIQCGEGGALVINNSKYIDRAEIIREKGTNRRSFINGEVKKYTWVDQGSSYLMAEICAAVLLGQLEEFESLQKIRENNWRDYKSKFEGHSKKFPILENTEKEIAHIFALITRSEGERDSLKDFCLSLGIQSTSHYEPLNNSSAGKKFGRSSGTSDNANRFAKTILRMPLWTKPMTSEIDFIAKSLEKLSANEI